MAAIPTFPRWEMHEVKDLKELYVSKSRSKKLGFRSKELGWSTVGA